MIDSETGYLFTNDENLLKKDLGDKSAEKDKKAKKSISFIFLIFFIISL